MITYVLECYVRDRNTQFKRREEYKFELDDDSKLVKCVLQFLDRYRLSHPKSDVVGAGVRREEHRTFEPVLGTASLEEAVKKYGKFE